MNAIYCNSALDSDPIDIDHFLPIKSDEEGIKFCGNDDGLLEQRKRSVAKRIYGAGDFSNITNFVSSVADVFFNVDYQITHRWPSKL